MCCLIVKHQETEYQRVLIKDNLVLNNTIFNDDF